MEITNEEIRRCLEEQAEPNLREWNTRLIPGADAVLGVRIPKIRMLAKEIAKQDWRTYLKNAREDSYEETLLQGLVIGCVKGEIGEILSYASDFIPKIHDWSVNDSFCSAFKIAAKNRERAWEFFMRYRESEREFEQRVVAVMLMDHFLTEEYIARTLDVWGSLANPGYYLKMGVAWGFATAYAKFPGETYAYLSEHPLDDYTYHKAIQKMLESYRIPAEEKEALRKMKRK